MENDVQKKPEKSGRKKLLPLLLIAVLLVAGGIFAGIRFLAGPSQEPEVEVSDFETLKEVMESAEGDRIITLTGDIQMTESITLPANVKITITDDGTPRTLIRWDMDGWMFWVPEGSALELKGTVDKGLVLDGNSAGVKCGPDGALLIGEYADFVMENVVLKDNRTNSGLGGLMRIVTCNVTAENSSFTGGTSKSGGAVYAIESNLAFTNCDLSDNRGTQGHGGALYVDNASTLSLNQCTLNNNYINTGSGYGGAVIITNFSQADIVDTTFDGNFTDHDGSACGGTMYIAWGSVANFSGKTAISNSYAKAGGGSNALGGAIYINEGSSMNVGEGVVFSGNNSTHGGAIYAIDTATVNLDGALFTDNHTTVGNGGAIYCWRGPVINAKNTTFVKNYTKSEGNAYGGAVAIATGGASGTFESCVFEGNYTDNVGFCNGGALLVGTTSKVTMSGENVFKDNGGKSTGGKNTCGGAIYVSDASLDMSEGTTFTGNYGSHGGAVYINANGKFIVDGAKFDDNSSYFGHGGAVCAWNGGHVTATNCAFTNNAIESDVGGYGGAVAVYNKDEVEFVSTGTFTNCTFDGNKTVRSSGDANANGGAMYIGMGADVTVDGGSVFSNNYAKVNAEKANCYGGAIYLNTNSVLNLSAATFTNNTAELGGAVMAHTSAKVNVSGASFAGNSASVDHGGAVYTIQTPTVIAGSDFAKNYAEKHGGAVMIVGVEEGANIGYGTITDCTFTGNYSKTNRGGAVAGFQAKNLSIDKCTFTENYTSYAHGGAVYAQNMPAQIKGSTFTKNYVSSEVGGYGGAVAVVNAKLGDNKASGTITDCVFDGNYVVRSGGKEAANGGAVYAGLGAKLTVNGKSEFKNNFAKAAEDEANCYGGAVYANTECQITVGEGVSFTGNTAELGGAVMTHTGAVVNVKGASFAGNSASVDHGGAVYTIQTPTVIAGSDFTENYAEKHGGAVTIVGVEEGENVGFGTITDCTFTGNYSKTNRGGAVAGFQAKNLAISGSTFTGNYTNHAHGGAVYAQNMPAEIKTSTFTKNYISGEAGGYGGAVAIVNAELGDNKASGTITDCVFDGNYVIRPAGDEAANGGAVYAGLGTKLTVSGKSEFKNNYAQAFNMGKAYNGGAIYANTDCEVTVGQGVSFTGNNGRMGGAIAVVDAAKLDVTGATFTGNYTNNTHGGAIYAMTTETVLKNSTFTGNKIESVLLGYGGAVAVDGESAENGKTLTVDNCVFDGNSTVRAADATANAHGGALYIGRYTKAAITGATVFKNNVAASAGGGYYGGAVYANTGCEVTVGQGVSFTGNSGDRGGAIAVNDGAKLNVTGAKFTGNTGRYGGAVAALNDAQLEVIGSTFADNTSTYAHGGAVYAFVSDAAVKSSTFTGNKIESVAGGYGGAVAIDSEVAATAKTLTIDSCVFDGNSTVRPDSATADANGGALYIGRYTKAAITGDTVFKNNVAQANTARKYSGGAIYANTGCEVTVGEGVSFAGNVGRMGGAIATVGAANLEVTGATFTGNSTNYAHGGAIYAETTETVLKDSTFTGNKIESSAGGYGGAVAVDGLAAATAKTLIVDNCVFDGNSTVRPDSAAADANGGALYIGRYTKANITGATEFKNNEAKAGDARKYNGGAIYTNTGCEVTVGEGVTFTGNKANMGGAIGAVDAKSVKLTGVTMSANEAQTADAAVYYNSKVTLTIEDVSITPVANAATTDITVPAGKTLEVSGEVDLGRVKYEDEAAIIKLTGAVEGTATLIPGKYEEGFQVVKAGDAAWLVGIGSKFAVADDSNGVPWILDDSGKLESMAPTVMIGETGYATLDVALNEAETGDVLKLIADTKLKNDAAVPAGVIINSEGFVVNALEGKTLTLGDGVKAENLTINCDVKGGATVVLTGAAITGNVEAGAGADLSKATIGGDVKAGDNADLSEANVTGSVEVGAGADLSKATIGGSAIVGDNVVLTGASIGGDVNGGLDNDTVKGVVIADAVDAAVVGKITVAEGSVLNVGGSFTAANVHLLAGAKINVASELTAEGKAFGLTSAVETIDTVLVTAADAEALKAAVEKITASFTNSKVGLGENGRIISDVYVAHIIRDGAPVPFETMSAAITAAQNGETIVVRKSHVLTAAMKVDKKNITIDGAGYTLTRGAQLTTTMVYIADGSAASELTLDNIVLDGNKGNMTAAATEALVFNRGKLTLNSGVTIQNADTGANGSAIYTNVRNVADVQTIINGATIKGSVNTKNGTIYVNGGTVEIIDANITGNNVTGNGGAIYVNAGGVTIEGTNFTGNSANTSGGAIFVNGDVDLEIGAGTSFTNNSAVTKHGGAIYMLKGDLIVEGGAEEAEKVTFKGNTATGNGGAIELVNPSTADIENAVFGGMNEGEGNVATGNGGVISADTKQTVKLTNVIAQGNTGTRGGFAVNNGTMTIDGGHYEGNVGTEWGGVVANNYSETAKLTVEGNATFTGNHTPTRGGVFYNHAKAEITIENGTFTGNWTDDTSTTKTYGGGVIYNNSFVDEEAEGKPRYVGTVTIKGGTFTGNGKVVSGAGKSFGGVVNNLGNLYITGGTFGGENASDANYAQQGAVVFNSDYAEITGGEFVGNKATAGALATNNSPANGIAKTVTKIGAATFSKNQGTDGGAIFIHQKGDLEIDGTTFTENKAAGHGGAIQLQKNTSLLIKDGTFTGNKTIGSTSIDGGAIFVNSNVSATIENGTFTGNTAKGKGGVIYSLSALTIDGGTFQNNSATGGGVVWADANVTVKDGIFKNNTATDGGVFFIDAGASADAPNVLTIKDGEFYGNKSTGTAANTNGGGVVHLRGFTKLDVQGGIFGAADAGNTSATDGGVIYRSAGEEGKTAKTVITITKTEGVELKFSHNQALGNNRMGGVFAFPSGAVTEFSADGAEFSYNKAVTGTAGNGGVFYNHTGGTMTLENCAFIGNEATGGGGVVYTAASSTLDVENCSFESNKAMYGGVMRNKAVANFSGSTFTGNTATDCGALYNDSQMTVKDCDFDGNTASKRGGAIFHNGTALTVDADCTFGTTKANTDTNNGGAVRTNDVWVHNGKPHTISATYVGWDQKAAKPLP